MLNPYGEGIQGVNSVSAQKTIYFGSAMTFPQNEKWLEKD
jgi:hypothetical protein